MSYKIVDSLDNIIDKTNIVPQNHSEPYKGKTYQCIATQDNSYKCSKRLGRVILGIIVVSLSIGFALLIKDVREFFTKKTYTITSLTEKTFNEKQKKVIKKAEVISPHKCELSDIEKTKTDRDRVKYKQVNKLLSQDELPFLLNIKLDQNNPLLKSIKNELDVNLLSTDLKEYLLGKIDFQKEYAEQQNLAFINERIKQFDEAFQLNSRIRFIKQKITFEDLLLDWENSNLKHLLLLDTEIQQLKVSHLELLPLDFVSTYMKASDDKDIDQENLTEKTIGNLSIFDIKKLKAPTLNRLIDSLPLELLAFISTDEVAHLKIDSLSEEQLNYLFRDLNRFNIDQINLHLEKIPPKLFKSLKNDKIKGLNFKKISKEIFNIIFEYISENQIIEKKRGIKNKEILQNLSSDQIEMIAQFFDKNYWKILTKEQIAGFTSKFLKENFDEIFNTYSNSSKEAFKELNKEFLNLRPKFEKKHWEVITGKQFLQLDLKSVTKQEFDFMFDMSNNDQKEKFKKLNAQHILLLKQHFTKNHWYHLTYDQLISLDIDTLRDNLQDILPSSKMDDFGKLPTAKLKKLKIKFKDHHWRALNQTQIKEMVEELRKEEFVQLTENQNDYKWLQNLGEELGTIQDLLSLEQYYLLIPSQFQFLDFKKLTKEQFNKMDFGNNFTHLNKLEVKQIYDIQNFLEYGHLCAFKIEKIKEFNIDFLELHFNNIFTQFKGDRMNYFKKLPKEALERLRPKFEKHHKLALGEK